MRRSSGTLALLAVLTLSACASPGGLLARATPSPGPPLTHAAFQAQLNRALETFAAALARVARAASPDALATALGAAGAAGRRAADTITFERVPADVRDSTGVALQSLRLMDVELPALARQAETYALCAGPSAMTRIAGLDVTGHLRTSLQEIAGRGYQVPDLVPAPTPDTTRHAGNGDLLLDPGRGDDGYGLEITNDTTQDSVATLLAGARPLLAMYTAAGATSTVQGIPGGSYTLDVALGDDWDASLRTFTRTCTYEGFDKPVVYDGSVDGWHYSLKPTPNGTLTLHRIPPGKFPRI